jgi:TPR repeat protein
MKSRAMVAATMLCMACGAGYTAEAADEAMAAYEQGNYVEAEVRLLRAARAGDAQAQEMLGFMYAIGPTLYPGVPRNLIAATLWFDRAARSGRPVARYMHCALARLEVPPPARENTHCSESLASLGDTTWSR